MYEKASRPSLVAIGLSGKTLDKMSGVEERRRRLQERVLKTAFYNTPILGRVLSKDTYNLLKECPGPP